MTWDKKIPTPRNLLYHKVDRLPVHMIAKHRWCKVYIYNMIIMIIIKLYV